MTVRACSGVCHGRCGVLGAKRGSRTPGVDDWRRVLVQGLEVLRRCWVDLRSHGKMSWPPHCLEGALQVGEAVQSVAGPASKETVRRGAGCYDDACQGDVRVLVWEQKPELNAPRRPKSNNTFPCPERAKDSETYPQQPTGTRQDNEMGTAMPPRASWSSGPSFCG